MSYTECELDDLEESQRGTVSVDPTSFAIGEDPAYDTVRMQIPTANAFLDPREVAPDTYFYRKAVERPKISDLREKVKEAKIKEAPAPKSSRKYGTFIGVFIPIIVNTMGTMFWNRSGKVVGNCGIAYSLIIIWIAILNSLITLTTMTALSTNGEVETGGIYYILSRTLGPELGRALGLFLILSHSFSAATALLGFAENVVSLYMPKFFTGSQINDIRVIAMCIIPFAAFSGRLVQYIRYATAIVYVISLSGYFVGIFINKPENTEGFLGLSTSTFHNNMYEPNMTVSTFMYNLGIIAPAFNSLLASFIHTGLVKRPEKMIPRGMMLGLGVTVVFFHLGMLSLGACGDRKFLRETLVTPYASFNAWFWLGFIGVTVYTAHRSVHSATAPQGIFNAMAADGLLPQVKFGYNIAIPIALTAASVGVGQLNIIARINTCFFMTMYAIIDHGVFRAARAHIPGWRPTSRLFNPWLSLFGCLMCVVIQFVVSWAASLAAWAAIGVITLFSMRKKSTNNWGSMQQAETYYDGLKHALSLQRIAPHPKLFRVNFLTAVEEDAEFEHDLIPFLDAVLGGEGFCIVSQAVDPSLGLTLAIEHREHFMHVLAHKHNIFFETVLAGSASEALNKQMLMGGLGSLRPNTVCLRLGEQSPEELFELVADVVDQQWGLILVARPSQIREEGTVDVWWLADDGGLSLLVPYMISKTKGLKLRVMAVAHIDTGDTIDAAEARMNRLVSRFRIPAEVVPIELSECSTDPSPMVRLRWKQLTGSETWLPRQARFLLLADLVREFSSGAALVASTLPVPRSGYDPVQYSKTLELISGVPSAFAFVRGNGESVLSWQV